MSDYGISWASWAFAQSGAANIDGTAINNEAALTSDAISNHLKLDTEVSVAIAYGATANEGVVVYVLGDTDGTNYETVDDAPWGFDMPYAVSVTRRRRFTVPAQVGSFKLLLTNDSGAQAAATVRYRQAVGTAIVT